MNTLEFADGPVVLRAEAIDNEEGKAEKSINATINNTLVDFNIPIGYFDMNPNAKLFTYVTSDQNQVLYTKQIESLPFSELAKRPQEYEGGKISIHFVQINPTAANLTTYQAVNTGSFSPTVMEGNGKQTASPKMYFEDIPCHDYYTLDNTYGPTLSQGVGYPVKLYEKINIGFVYLRVGNAGYYYLEKDMQDTPYDRSLGQMKFQMTKHDLKINQAFDKIYFDAYAHTNAGNEGPKLPIYQENPLSQANYGFVLHTPSAEPTFNHYSSEIRLQLKPREFSLTKYDGIIADFEKLQTNFSLTNKTLSAFAIATNGDSFDGLLTRWVKFDGDMALNWMVYSKDATVKFPAIAPAITTAFPNFKNATFATVDPGAVQITAFEYDNISGYDEFVNRTFGRNGFTLLEGAKKYKAVSEVFN